MENIEDETTGSKASISGGLFWPLRWHLTQLAAMLVFLGLLIWVLVRLIHEDQAAAWGFRGAAFMYLSVKIDKWLERKKSGQNSELSQPPTE